MTYPILKQTDIDSLMQATSPDSVFVTVTPEASRYILTKYNLDNRPLKAKKIKQYANDMRRGDWGLTGDTIKFSDAGRLRDGQNRFAGCIEAMEPFPTLLICGVEDNLFDVMDQGKNRSAADVFAISRIQYAAPMAAAVRWLEIITGQHPMSDRISRTPTELVEAYTKKYPNLQDSFTKEVKRCQRNRSQPAGLLIALRYLFAQSSPAKADQFFADWADNVAPTNRDPLRVLNDRYTFLITQGSGRIHDRLRLLLVVAAWNQYIKPAKWSASEIEKLTISSPWPGVK